MKTPTARRVHLIALLYVAMAQRGAPVDAKHLEWAKFIVRANRD